MDFVKRAKQNKKRPGAPIVSGVNKMPKIGPEHSAPKMEAVDAPTKPPKPVKQPKAEKKVEKKPQQIVVPSSSKESIQLCWVDREKDAKLQTKSVKLPSEDAGHRGPSTTGLQIIEKPTLNTQTKCKEFLRWFLWPLPVDEFFNAYWEKRVFVLQRHLPTYWDGWFSSDQLRDLTEQGRLHYGTDIDVTMYKDGQRFTLNIGGDEPAQSEVVWDLFEKSKCSVRVLRPQEYSDNVSRMLALLEESFLSGFGSNAYYTPAGSQGFAPHWDDVEAFVLQLEGRKKWKIHGLGGDEELLPRFSSRNFSQEEVGGTIMEVVLEPGDLLYFPRGTIHQAMSDDTTDSFHLTVSCAQKNCWADLMDIAVNAALIQASKNMTAYRESLPKDYGSYMGVMHSDAKDDDRRKAFLRTAMALCEAFSSKFLPEQIDDAADKMMCRFLYDRQPPQAMLSLEEQGIAPAASSSNGANKMDTDLVESGSDDGEGGVDAGEEEEEPITDETKLRIVSKHCCRLVIEENASLYYASGNSVKYHEVDSMKIEMPLVYAEAIEFLVSQYPKYVAVKEIPLETEEERLDLANELLDKQIAMVE